MSHSRKLITAATLHWVSAFLTIAMLVLGWSFDNQPPENMPKLLTYHLTGGSVILCLGLTRILSGLKYRTLYPHNPFKASVILKKITHSTLAFSLIIVPVTGLITLSGHEVIISLGRETTFQQAFSLLNHSYFENNHLLHKWSVNLLTLMMFIHISAALSFQLHRKISQGSHHDE